MHTEQLLFQMCEANFRIISERALPNRTGSMSETFKNVGGMSRYTAMWWA